MVWVLIYVIEISNNVVLWTLHDEIELILWFVAVKRKGEEDYFIKLFLLDKFILLFCFLPRLSFLKGAWMKDLYGDLQREMAKVM